MTQNSNKEELPTDELICPITLELFRDLVRAKDGHVYEREAITRWILQHGTSPLTREPLQVTDLQPNDRLRNLARARRNSTVSYNSRNEQVTLPPLQRRGRYSHRAAPASVPSPVITPMPSSTSINIRCPKDWPKTCCTIFFLLIVSASLTVGFIFRPRSSRGGHRDGGSVLSTYRGTLTTNSSKFNRLYSSTSGQYYYDEIGIRVSMSGSYEFFSESSMDMYGYLYVSPFNDTNVYSNILKYDDNSGRCGQFHFNYPLRSNLNYVLIATTYGVGVTGSFTTQIKGSSTVTFN